MSDPHFFWYLTRASGLLAYVLLFACVGLGLLLTVAAPARAGRHSRGRGWLQRHQVYDLHRFLSLITLGVTVFHVFIVLPDSYFSFTLRELLVPFASPYRPSYMALGVLSLYLTGLFIIAFHLRPLVPYAAWRLLHYGTFIAFLFAFLHGVGAGADTGTAWALALYGTTGAVVLGLLAVRLLQGSARRLGAGRGRAAASRASPTA